MMYAHHICEFLINAYWCLVERKLMLAAREDTNILDENSSYLRWLGFLGSLMN